MKRVLGLLLAMAWAVSAQATTPDLEAIAEVGESYIAAFDKGDAKAVAACWAADADYTDLDGRTHRGREALEMLFAGFFAERRGMKLGIDSQSLRFVSPDVAIEDGVTVVSGGDAPPSAARYSSTLVKRDGKWLLASVREAPIAPAERSAELGVLAPILGNWTATTKDSEVRVTLAPDDTGNFLTLRRTVLAGGLPASAGVDWIAWDPAAKSIRSWTFQSDGSFGKADWKQDGTTWTIESRHTLRDGTKLCEKQSLSLGKDGKLTSRTLSLSAEEKDLPLSEDLVFSRPSKSP
jgi:uncharacterized protein (TIGR02246 family)